MILLFLLPFYDRGPERHPLRRPVATLTGIFVICAMAYLTFLGANAGPPTENDQAIGAVVAQGKQALASSTSAAPSSRSRAARRATRSAPTATTGPVPS